jgi:hypothetical protein
MSRAARIICGMIHAAQPLDAKQEPRYWAFISYSRHDQRLARWLARALSQTAVPRRCRSRIAAKSRTFAPVFLDVLEGAAASVLSDELAAALRESASLIVICSPFAVASPHVADEIAFFKSLGRGDRILCLVASGVPNATDAGNPALECFPAPLRFRVDADATVSAEAVPMSERPLAATVGQESPSEQRQAIDQIAAGLLDVSQGELRALRRAESGRRVALAAAAAVAIGAAGLATWDGLVREHVEYYRDFARRNGIWEGIGRTASPDDGGPAEAYMFRTRGRHGPLTAVDFVDGQNLCPAGDIRSITRDSTEKNCTTIRGCAVQFAYRPDGSIEDESIVDQFGHEIERLHYIGPSVGTFVQAQYPCSRGSSGIEHIEFTRYSEGELAGLDREIRFQASDRSLRQNGSGAYGLHFERAPDGRELSESILGPDGQVWAGKFLYASTRRSYDAAGNHVGDAFFDERGSPTLSKEGVASWRAKLDSRGNVIEIANFDERGAPTFTVDERIAGWRAKRDSLGRRVEVAYFGPDNQSILHKNGHALRRVEYGEEGRSVSVAYFGLDGRPTLSIDGAASWRETRDEAGNQTEVRYFGIDGQPILTKDGYSARKRVYDESGNIIEETVFGTDGERILDKEGVAITRSEFDERGLVVRKSFFGMDGKPILYMGVASWRAQYDARGNVSEIEHFGVDGDPTLHKDGIVGIRQGFDEQGTSSRSRTSGQTAVRRCRRMAMPDGAPSSMIGETRSRRPISAWMAARFS